MATLASNKIPARAWLILLLSGLAAMLFYVDRQTLSVLKTTMKAQFVWTDADYGQLVALYMVPYTLCYLITGRLIDRWGTKIMMPVFIGGMSLATVGTGLADNFWGFGASRFILGMAEAGIIPAVIVAIVKWFPADMRGTATTLNKPLTVAGHVIVVPLATWLTVTHGWRSAFIIPGLFGLACAAAWWLIDRGPVATRVEPTVPDRLPTYREVLAKKEIRALLLARIVSDPLWFFLVFWQPGYLQEELGLSLTEFGQVGWIPPAVAMLGLMAFGITSDAMIRRGETAVRSRVRVLIYASLLAPAVVALGHTSSTPLALALLSLVHLMTASWLSLSGLLMSDLVPPRMVGTTVAVMSALGATTATLFNLAAGPLVAAIGYGNILLAAALLHPLAATILWRAYGRGPKVTTAPTIAPEIP